MKKILPFLIPALLVAAAKYPEAPPPDVYVLDQAGVIDESHEELINNLCREVERTTGAEMAVLTVSTTDGEEMWSYATEVGNKWGVGQKSEDNGLILVAAIDDRQVFTATGSGMESTLPDATIDRIYRGVLVPNFRASEYGKGIYEALQLYAKEIEKTYGVEFQGAKDAPVLEKEKPASPFSCFRGFFCVSVLPFLFIFILFSLLGRLGGKSGSGRSGGFWSSGGGSSSGGGGFSGGGFGGGGFSGGGGGGGW